MDLFRNRQVLRKTFTCSRSEYWRTRLQQSFIEKAVIVRIGKDEMVQDVYPHQLCRVFDVLGQSDVFRAWPGVAARMVVRQD